MADTLPTISLCMIVKNEAENIQLCLDSVKAVVDEIIIVDTGSTDTTVAVCKGYTDKIYHFQWCDDFSAARNESIKYATKDWILILDGDELLAPSTAKTLKKALADIPASERIICPLNYEVPRQVVLDHVRQNKDIPLSMYVCHRHPRLFRNHLGYFYTYRLHENIQRQNTSADEIAVKPFYIIHHGYDQASLPPAAHKKRRERNLQCLLKDLQDHPDDPHVLFNIAREKSTESDSDWITYADQAIQSVLQKKQTYSLRVLYNMYVQLLLKNKEYRKALTIAYDWIKRLNDGYDLFPYVYLADSYFLLEQPEQAQHLYELVAASLSKKLPHPYFEEIPDIERKVYHQLGLLYAAQGNYAKAAPLLHLLKTKQLLPETMVDELLTKAQAAAGIKN